jgi:hypothetical protein
MLRGGSRVLAFALGLLLAVASLRTGALAAETPAGSADLSLTGEVLDMACYISHGGKGETHKPCAAKCAKLGQPVGLLSTDGKLYLLVADHADGAPYEKARGLAGEQVAMKGEVAERDGVTALTVHDVKKK